MYFLLCILLLCAWSIYTRTRNSEIVFPETRELYAVTIPMDTAIFRYPFRIQVHGDRAVLLDLHGADYFFHLFTYPEFRYLSSFGKRGESPDEIVSTASFRWNDSGLWILDSGRSALIRWELNELSDSMLHKETVRLSKDILLPLDFVQYDDSTWIVPDHSGEHALCWVSRSGQLRKKSGSIPTLEHKDDLKETPAVLAQAWRSFLDYHPDSGVLVSVTQLGEVLEVTREKDRFHSVYIGDHGEPQFWVAGGYGIPTGVMGFSDVQVTDRAIYTVFHGRSFQEIEESHKKGQYLPDGGQYILAYSLDGKPQCKYVLDRYIYGIYVDEKLGLIWATDVNSDEPLAMFSLKS